MKKRIKNTNEKSKEIYDFIIIGAGRTGVETAIYLSNLFPDETWIILEKRADVGGTWHQFNYPGVRSDTSMFAYGYKELPWNSNSSIGNGDEILSYIKEGAKKFIRDGKIQFNKTVTELRFSDKIYSICVKDPEGSVSEELFARDVVVCTGYFDQQPYYPCIEGLDSFRGRLIHAQSWDHQIESNNTRIAVVGSGATAISLAPALSKSGHSVTVVQRTKPAVLNRNSRIPGARHFRRIFGERITYLLFRRASILSTSLKALVLVSAPTAAFRIIRSDMSKALGDDSKLKDFFADRPSALDRRVCITIDNEYFREIKDGRIKVENANHCKIEPEGIRVDDDRLVACDTIVLATGFDLQFLGGIKLYVDGQLVETPNQLSYQGIMLEGVPNLFYTCGWFVAPAYAMRIPLQLKRIGKLRRARRQGDGQIIVPLSPGQIDRVPGESWNASFIQRGANRFPKHGRRYPWKQHKTYFGEYYEANFRAVSKHTIHIE